VALPAGETQHSGTANPTAICRILVNTGADNTKNHSPPASAECADFAATDAGPKIVRSGRLEIHSKPPGQIPWAAAKKGGRMTSVDQIRLWRQLFSINILLQ